MSSVSRREKVSPVSRRKRRAGEADTPYEACLVEWGSTHGSWVELLAPFSPHPVSHIHKIRGDSQSRKNFLKFHQIGRMCMGN